MTTVETPSTTLQQDIVKEFMEESGFKAGVPPTDQQRMLAQKYGIMSPQFTELEQSVIDRESNRG